MRSLGRSPAVICRSEASRSIISSNNWRRFTPPPGTGAAVLAGGAGATAGAAPIASKSRRRKQSNDGSSCARSRARLANDLLDRRYALEDLEPPVHAQRQHPFLH